MFDSDSAAELYSSVAIEILSLALLSKLTVLLIRSAREAAHRPFDTRSTSLAIVSFSGSMYTLHYALALRHTILRISSSGPEPDLFVIDTLGDALPVLLWWADNGLLFGLHHFLYVRIKRLLEMSAIGYFRPRGKSDLTPGWDLKYSFTGTCTILVGWASLMQWAAASGSLDYTTGKESEMELYRLRQASIDRYKYINPVLLGVLVGDLALSSTFTRRGFASTLKQFDVITNTLLFAFSPVYLAYFLFRLDSLARVAFQSSRDAIEPVGMAGRALFQVTLLSMVATLVSPSNPGWPLFWFRNRWIQMVARMAGHRGEDD